MSQMSDISFTIGDIVNPKIIFEINAHKNSPN